MTCLLYILLVIFLTVMLFGGVISIALFIAGIFNPKYQKIGAILISIVLIFSCVLGGFISISTNYCSEEIIDSTPIEVIALPSASVEIISIDNKISEVRIIESLTNAVEVRSYTNVKLNAIPNELTTLSLEKQDVCYRFLGLNLMECRKNVAILS